MAKKTVAYRVKFVYDDDATFEESNGEARPMTEEEYKGNEYYACPVHTRGDKSADLAEHGVGTCMRPVVQSDEDAANARPNAKPAVCGRQYAPVPYDEYLAYYGNPDRHVYLGVVVQKQCKCCGKWTEAGSLWRIDFMDDNREYLTTHLDHWYTPEDAIALFGYAGSVAGEVLDEAGYSKKAKPLTRAEVAEALAAYYSKEMHGKVWAYYDEAKRAYCIRGENLPAAPELQAQHPNGWSMVDYIKPAKARKLIKGGK